MKKGFPWSSLLLALLAVSVLVNVALGYKYVRLAGIVRKEAMTARILQEKVAAAQRDRAVLQAMAIESLKYARRHPEVFRALAPFLPAFRQLGINVTSNAPPARVPDAPNAVHP
jgi:ABC-type microcin C transport system permease subunit YejE